MSLEDALGGFIHSTKRFLVRGALGASLMFVTGYGCGDAGGGAQQTIGCKTDQDCKGGRICYEGDCVFMDEIPPSCEDEDGDGYGLHCDLGDDCDDNNSSAHEKIDCSYDGSSCGEYRLCAEDCPTIPQEVCDSVDNNCNNEVDESLTQACYSDCGTGTETCVNGAWVNCDAPQPSAEVCDGVDNDCNGSTDEDLEKYVSCGYNEKGQQKQVCSGGNWTDSGACNDPDVCKNDETLEQPCGSDVGECQEGIKYKTCFDGQWDEWSSCQGEVLPTDEICDGFDNDCNGKIDDFFGEVCYNGIGECITEGMYSCSEDSFEPVCNAIPETPKNEVCDSLDNDCDGDTDEDLTQTCYTDCGEGLEYCVNGTWKNCDAQQPSEEICDGIDNDCNGVLDGNDDCNCWYDYYYPVDEKCCVGFESGGEILDSLLCVIDSFDPKWDDGLTALAWDGQHLWYADFWGIYKSTTNGETVDSIPLLSPLGLAWDGQYLWVVNVDGANGQSKIDKIATTGQPLDSFDPPAPSPTGLTWDGQYLWNAEEMLGEIYKLTVTGEVLDAFYSPGDHPTGLAWDGTHLWNSDYNHDKIYKLTTTGEILGSFGSPGSAPWGLAWDGTHLWHADFYDKIYKLQIIE